MVGFARIKERAPLLMKIPLLHQRTLPDTLFGPVHDILMDQIEAETLLGVMQHRVRHGTVQVISDRSFGRQLSDYQDLHEAYRSIGRFMEEVYTR
jgi:hypothetical protein